MHYKACCLRKPLTLQDAGCLEDPPFGPGLELPLSTRLVHRPVFVMLSQNCPDDEFEIWCNTINENILVYIIGVHDIRSSRQNLPLGNDPKWWRVAHGLRE